MMNEPNSSTPAQRPQDSTVAVVDLLLEQRRRWRDGERVLVEAYFERHPALASDAEAALDLIGNELLLRQEAGETPALQDFVQRFPRWSSLLKVQFAVEEAIESAALHDTSRLGDSDSALASPSTFPHSPSLAAPLAIRGYEMQEELGRGGQSMVYKARQVSLNRLVALKVILGGAAADAEDRVRFRREAEAIAHMKHPNIVQIHDVGEQDGHPYFALEFVAGGTLAKKLGGMPLPARQTAQLMETLARTMHAAHQAGIVHRDLKPGNILLTEDDTPKITDFGLAKRLEGGDSLTQTGCNILGTPSYMAPEQAVGNSKDVGPAADVYALGALLYEMLTGRPPFTGATPWDILPQVLLADAVPPRRLQPLAPRDLETICLKCLHKSPAARYPSAQALADDLARYLGGEPIQARPTPRWERGLKWTKRHPLAATFIVASILLLMCGVWAGMYHTATIQQALDVAENQRKQAERERRNAQDNLREASAILNELVSHVAEEMNPGRYGATIEQTRKDILIKAQEFSHSLLAESGSDPELRQYAANANVDLASNHAALGQNEEAQAAFAKGIRLGQELVAEFPENDKYPLTLARAYNDFAGFSYNSKQLAEAGRAIQQAIALQENQEQKTPDDPTLLHNLGDGYDLKGLILLDQGARHESEEAMRKSLAFNLKAANLERDDRKDRPYRMRIAMTYGGLADLLLTDNRQEQAIQAFGEALNIMESLAREVPDNPLYQQQIASIHFSLGYVQARDWSKIDEGAVHLAAAIDVATRYLERYPFQDETFLVLALASLDLGQSQWIFRVSQGEQLFQQGARHCKSLMLRFPDDVRYRNTFVEAHEFLYTGFRKNNRPGDAEKVAISAHSCYSELQAQRPEVYAPLAQQALTWLIDATLEQRKHPDAVSAATKFPGQYPDQWEGHYKAAETIAHCLELVEGDSALQDPQRAALQTEYAKLALQQLRLALSKGYGDRQALQTAPAFKALQPLPEFKELTSAERISP